MILRGYLFPFFAYFKYWLIKEGRYAIQSPQIYELYNGLLIFVKESVNRDLDLEEIRNLLLNDHEILHIDDFGAGSKKLKSTYRKTSSITKYSTSSKRYSKLYQYFCTRTPAKVVVELGTCVGINTRYLSRVTKGRLFTFEGSDSLWKKAQENKIPENTQYIRGTIDETLPRKLYEIEMVDFVLIDATHTYDASLLYFRFILPYIQDSSIIALADIHWSAGMSAAWEKIKNHPRVIVSLDFYECGLLIFDKKFTKAAYVLEY
ncbi:O-methyltransferase [Aquiflexum lacus]|uniref:O-methyltransferase n=1 Tax=Aquiflexum lacus TaxID=2483805 RepID=UPI001E3C77E1|nr:class I SAM-dependent methyltransferase [Aquiflexum lacus]